MRQFKTMKSTAGGREITLPTPGTVASASASTINNTGTPFCLFTAAYTGVLSNLRVIARSLMVNWAPTLSIQTGAVTVHMTVPQLSETVSAVDIPNLYSMSQDDVMSLTYTGDALTGTSVELSFVFTRA